ncbi:PIN domain-containing protein [Streptomyces mirabilis]|uniref:PIN domain-containing protein n=1 Tax=Streptomyces mirabilis TaxID=68239 RepID=UPI0036DCF258
MPEHRSSTFTLGYEEFGRKSEQFVDQAIRSSSIILDTNAILNLYRMKPSARNEYLQVLEKIANRIWIPRQVANEFHRNRISCVDSHANSLKEKHAAVTEAASNLRGALGDFYKLHSLADGRSAEHLAPLNNAISRITDSIAAEVAEYDLSPGPLLSQDPILERLSILFDGKVGVGIPESEQAEQVKEAVRRGKDSTPPGYIDIQKKGEEGVGDYLIWKEMLEHAKEGKKNVLFISTDTKKDWMRVQCGMTVGPRPELVSEMLKIAGVAYHQLPLAQFLARAAHVLDVRVSQDTIDQANETPRDEMKAKLHIEKRVQQIKEIEERMATMQKMSREIAQQRDAAQQSVMAARERAVRSDSPEILSKLFAEVDEAQAYLENLEEQYRKVRDGLATLRSQRTSFTTEVRVLEAYAI